MSRGISFSNSSMPPDSPKTQKNPSFNLFNSFYASKLPSDTNNNTATEEVIKAIRNLEVIYSIYIILS
jgi:hypothetical protein